jgi:hypothetical protein
MDAPADAAPAEQPSKRRPPPAAEEEALPPGSGLAAALVVGVASLLLKRVFRRGGGTAPASRRAHGGDGDADGVDGGASGGAPGGGHAAHFRARDLPPGPGVVAAWSVAAVCDFLTHIDLGHLAGAFQDNGIDGAMLLSLTAEDFAELGVVHRLQRVRARARGPAQNTARRALHVLRPRAHCMAAEPTRAPLLSGHAAGALRGRHAGRGRVARPAARLWALELPCALAAARCRVFSRPTRRVPPLARPHTRARAEEDPPARAPAARAGGRRGRGARDGTRPALAALAALRWRAHAMPPCGASYSERPKAAPQSPTARSRAPRAPTSPSAPPPLPPRLRPGGGVCDDGG